MDEGEPVTYTDGCGTVGRGTLAPGGVVRGDEESRPAPAPRLTLAVAPPRAAERARFLVEKAAELGVDRLLWLSSRHTQGRVPRGDRTAAWACGALEQSRGAWLLEVGGPLPLHELETPLWVLQKGAPPPPPATANVILAVGPEGGLAAAEVPDWAALVGVGERVLRVETAALAGSVLALDRLNRL